MKKTLTAKTIALMAAGMMTASALPVTAFAEELYPTGEYNVLAPKFSFGTVTDEPFERPVSSGYNLKGSYFGSGSYSFGNTLTADQKVIYNEMAAALSINNGAQTCTITIPPKYRDDVIGNNDALGKDIMPAFNALTMDHPEYVGISNGRCDWSVSTATPQYAQITFDYCSGQKPEQDGVNSVNTVKSKVSSIVSLASGYSSKYDKLKFFAEYLCDNVTYNQVAADTGIGDNFWNAYGALVNGESVCEGYAESFKLLCDAINVPCALMVSDNHEWNFVNMNGVWYYVDVTWMDTKVNGKYNYDWFMVGTDKAKKNDQRNSHVPTQMTYPVISKTDLDPASAAEPAKPQNVQAVAGTNSAILTWNAVPGATKYAVAYFNGSSYTTLTLNCTGTNYTAEGLTGGKTYQFLVQANVNGKWSSFTSADHVSVTPKGSSTSTTKPQNVQAIAGTNSAILTWNAVPGATKYAIAYYENGSYTTLTLNCTGTSYTAEGLTGGKTYQFLVQANVNGRWSPFTSADHVYVTPKGSSISTTKPQNVLAVAGTNSATLTWGAVPGASKYAIAYYENSSYTTLTLNCTSTSFTAAGLTGGKTYQFLVQANVNGRWSPFTSADHVSVTPAGSSISTTKPQNVQAAAGTNSATLTWNAVPGASRYAIAYYENGSYTTLTLNCTSTSFTAAGLTGGKTYQFLVQANVNGRWSPFTSADHVYATPFGGSTKPSNIRAAVGINSAILSWDAVSGASRYAIAYYENGSYTTLTLNCTSTSYMATGLIGGRTYQFLVQAYVNGKWSPFTSADHVSVTISSL